MRIYPLGDSAMVVEVGDGIDVATHRRVQRAWRAIEAAKLPGVLELAPAYASVTLFYDPAQVVAHGADPARVYEWLEDRVRAIAIQNRAPAGPSRPMRTVVIPVCYGGEYGPDLDLVAEHTRLPAAEVIRHHHSAEYFVHMIGFAPGFPYLGGLPPALRMPRRPQPRTQVPPGSVAITGLQSAVYPLATPGGWNLIGRTPLRLFRPGEDPPVLLSPGDQVRFQPISAEAFERWEDPR